MLVVDLVVMVFDVGVGVFILVVFLYFFVGVVVSDGVIDGGKCFVFVVVDLMVEQVVGYCVDCCVGDLVFVFGWCVGYMYVFIYLVLVVMLGVYIGYFGCECEGGEGREQELMGYDGFWEWVGIWLQCLVGVVSLQCIVCNQVVFVLCCWIIVCVCGMIGCLFILVIDWVSLVFSSRIRVEQQIYISSIIMFLVELQVLFMLL